MQSNIFVVDQNDYTVHIQLTIPDGVITVEAHQGATPVEKVVMEMDYLLRITKAALIKLKADGFKPDPSKGARKSGGNPNFKPPQPVIVNGVEMKCPKCSGKVYDNREENTRRKASGEKERPEFACRDKIGCSWIKWPDREQVQGAVNPSPQGGYVDKEFASLAGTAALAEELSFP